VIVRATILVSAVLAILAGARLAAQQPSFRASVEVVLIDVSVVDRSAFPVDDLRPTDFTVTVDGKPRRILTAQFLSHRAPGLDDVSRVERGQRPPDVIESQRVGTGLDVILAVDEDSLEPGDGSLAKRAIGRFLNQLSPTDRIAIVTIPRLPGRIGLTSNRLDLFDALSRINSGIAHQHGQHRIGLAEAFEIERHDEVTLNDVIERECVEKVTGVGNRSDVPATQELEACRIDVTIEAKQFAITAHDRAQRSLDALRRLAGLLSSIPRPKTLVLVSGGFPAPISPTGFSLVASALAAGQVNLYSLYLEKDQFGSALGQPSPTAFEDDSLERYGIENVTSEAGGTLMLVNGDFEPHFDRVVRELSGSYLLGVEVEAGDRDGNPHRVEVKVNRTGVSIRSRKQYVIGSPAGRAGALDAGSAGIEPGSTDVGRTELETGFGQLSYNRMLTAARDLEGTGDVYVTVKAQNIPQAGSGGREVMVQATIDPRSVYFISLDGRRVARLGVSIFCGDSKHVVVGEMWQEVNLALKDDTYARYKEVGIPYTARVSVRGDPRYVKIVVYDFRSDLVGSMTTKVK
jgi:VWFA-related protein